MKAASTSASIWQVLTITRSEYATCRYCLCAIIVCIGILLLLVCTFDLFYSCHWPTDPNKRALHAPSTCREPIRWMKARVNIAQLITAHMSNPTDDSSLLVLLLETHPAMWSTLAEATNGLDSWAFLQQARTNHRAHIAHIHPTRCLLFSTHTSPCLRATKS